MRQSVALAMHRYVIRRIATAHRVGNVRVFDFVARGTDSDESDLLQTRRTLLLIHVSALRHST